jgi:hypothetical protein
LRLLPSVTEAIPPVLLFIYLLIRTLGLETRERSFGALPEGSVYDATEAALADILCDFAFRLDGMLVYWRDC